MAQTMGTLTGPAKLAAVTDLLDRLSKDLETISLLPHQRDAALEELKVYGRDPRNADPIFTKHGIETLSRHAFNSPSSTTSRNALRCLCNALLLNADTRQIFADLNYESKACNKLKNDNRDDEFLISRIIFLTTYAKVDLHDLIDKHHIGEAIIKNLERHAKRVTIGAPSIDPMEGMALIETLKLLFNISHYCKDRTSEFTAAVPHIITLICQGSYPTSKPLDAPVVSLVNALLNLDIGAKEVQASLYPPAEATQLSDRLIGLLKASSKVYNNEELENTVTALIGVIRGLHEYAPEDVKTSLRASLLPTEDDRKEVLGRSPTIASWLLRNSTNPVTPQLREAISDLLFDMSDKDSSKFVQNVGYGFAAGFLFSRGLPVPQNAQEGFADADVESRPVNPITGQFLDAEIHPNIPEMTEDEKEREAERLFVLFERLRANGVISAENPVRVAQQSGRFEELPDDYEEEDDD
ncbi:guanine nucleotide exchange factor [Truncatella angustata]|uniref:Guanine nucleotide exchange factor n=1 Tax=Truncatella angustata TaxID=152316 RepID=A0A9P9A0P1_9PEZI|nr:guanine nucleotide exchange factor [Truncatella angustata]KAH6657289.1 guanine nucleotide exchange factor [Truncatella angustata]